MSMNIEIRVDAPQALTTSNAVEGALGKVEAMGPKIGASLSRGFQDGSSAAEKAKQSATSLTDQFAKMANTGKAFEGLTEQFKREADMLERINGPAREYMANLSALDALQSKNAISTEQYVEQVTRLNQQLDRAQGRSPASAATTPTAPQQGGGSMGGIEGVAKMAGIGFGVHELAELSDSYTEIGNKLRVVSTDEANFNSLMSQTKQIAGDTRTGWEATASTFQRLSNVTHDLGLSQRQVLDLTKEMAEGAKVSGASAFEAQMAMGELTHAFATGSLQGREFRVLMRDTPALMHELQVASGKTGQEFAEMGKHGQISANLLIEWFDKAKASIHDKFGQQVPTVTEMLSKLKNEVIDLVGKFVAAFDVMKQLGSVFSDVSKVMGIVSDAIGAVKGAMSTLTSGVANVIGINDKSASKFKEVGSAIFDYALHPLHALTDGYGVLKTALTSFEPALIAQSAAAKAVAADTELQTKTLNEQIDALQQDIMAHGTLIETMNRMADALAEGNKLFDEQGDKMLTARAQVDGYGVALDKVKAKIALFPKSTPLSTILDAGDVTIVRGFQDAQEHLIDQSKAWGAELEKIHDKEAKRQRGIEDLNAALKHGDINQREYTEAVKEFLPHVTKVNHELERRIANEYALYNIGLKKSRDQGYGEPQLNFEAPDLSAITPKEDPYAKRAMTVYEQLGGAVEKYGKELTEIQTLEQLGYLNENINTRALQTLHDKYDDMRQPLERFAEDMKEANDKRAAGIFTTTEHIAKVAELNDKYREFKTPAEEYAAGLRKIQLAEVNGQGSAEALEDAARKLRMQFGELGQTTFADGVDDGLDKIRKSVVDTASTISTAMVGAFDAVNTAMVDMVTTGKLDLNALDKSLEKIAATAALKQLEGGIAGLFANKAVDAGSSAATAASSGATYGATANAAITTGAAIAGGAYGAAAAAAIAAGTAANAGVSAAGAAVSAGASQYGSTTIIPHAANGYAARIGGRGGTDSQLFMSWVTPGETARITTPAQERASQQQGASQPTFTIINKHDTRGELLDALDSGTADKAVLNVLKRNPGFVRSISK